MVVVCVCGTGGGLRRLQPSVPPPRAAAALTLTTVQPARAMPSWTLLVPQPICSTGLVRRGRYALSTRLSAAYPKNHSKGAPSSLE